MIEQNTKIHKHFIKEKLDNGLICTPYVSTDRRLANILTKDLSSTTFQASISKLGKYLFTSLGRSVEE